MRTKHSKPFLFKVEVPDKNTDPCVYSGTEVNDSSVTATIQLCPEVVRLVYCNKFDNEF